MIFYTIRNVNTGKMVESHDTLSIEWARTKVKAHNRLYPCDLWTIEAD